MRLFFVTQEDPFYIKLFFETFCGNYEALNEVQGVIICKTMGRSRVALIKKMYAFYGAVDFFRIGIRYVGNKLLSLVLNRVYLGRFFGIGHVCKHYGIEVIWCNDVNSPDVVSMLKEKEVDIIVSVAAPQIFKMPLLQVAKWGCINIHNAKLPKYRGMLPSFWNMFHNEERSAITIHTMDLKIDRGKVLLQREFEIKPKESLDQLIKRSKALGALYLMEVLENIKQGRLVYKDVNEREGSYFSFPTRQDVKQFRRMGKRLL